MNDILILRDKNGGTAILTTASPASHYGIPVLQIDADDVSGDFGPGDLLGELPNIFPAANIVAAWGRAPERTNEEREIAARYLRQWPEGPQVETPAAMLGRLGGQVTGISKSAAAVARNARRKADGKPEGGRPVTGRAAKATERLAALKDAAPEKRAQALDAWLQVATPAEVRRAWKDWMGHFPEWAADSKPESKAERDERKQYYAKLAEKGHNNPVERKLVDTTDRQIRAKVRALIDGHTVYSCRQNYLAPADPDRAARGLETGFITAERWWWEIDGKKVDGGMPPTIGAIRETLDAGSEK